MGTRFASKQSVLAICGGGNAGHALAVVTSQNFDGDVVWLTSSDEKAELLRRGVFSGDGLQSTGAIKASAKKVRRISSNAAELIPDADIVIIAVPTFAHAAVLEKISPHLKDTALLGSLPTRGGFEFEVTNIIKDIEPRGQRKVFGLQTLPWSTRVQQAGRTVNFGAIKGKVHMATFPRNYASDLAVPLSQILGIEIIPTDNFLNMTLGNPGQVVHCGIMYGLFASWSGQTYTQEEVPNFYADVSDEMGGFIEKLSSDIIAIARKIETLSARALDLSGVLSIHEWLKISYPTQTKDLTTVATSFRTGPIQARKAPVVEGANGRFVPNFQYRYLSEDVPYGLAISKSIGQLVGVATPAIDAVLEWATQKLDKSFWSNGELEGTDTRALPIPQNYGIHTAADLISWYVSDRVASSAASAVDG